MEKQDIIDFFDELAAGWDENQIIKETVIETILNNSCVTAGRDILDVACGTGVLFPYYSRRKVNSVTGIDISPEMMKISKEKFPEIEIICGDAEEYNFRKSFDVIMIYNAFPHFSDPEKLIKHLSGFLKKGGRLCVAHSMSRAELQKHHSGSASKVSLELPPAEELAKILQPHFDIDIIISDAKMYQVSGVKR